MKRICDITQKESKNLNYIDIELIISHVLKKPREFILMHPETPLTFWQQKTIQRFIKKRKQGTPLAYITGHKQFYGLDFFVNKHVLVPRPETELMVELVIQKIQTQKNNHKNILIDLGTGSGCIPIAIMAGHQTSDVGRRTFAIDISKQALRVAKKNATRHNVHIQFLHGNLLTPVLQNQALMSDVQGLIITANLPYLTQQEIDDERSIQKEPRLALYADDNGLALYKKLFEQVKQLSINVCIFCEINDHQADELLDHAKKILPNAVLNIHKDFAGHRRVVSVSL